MLTVIIIDPVADSRTRKRLERLTVIDFLKIFVASTVFSPCG